MANLFKMKILSLTFVLLLLVHGCMVNKSNPNQHKVDDGKKVVMDTTAATPDFVETDSAVAAPIDNLKTENKNWDADKIGGSNGNKSNKGDKPHPSFPPSPKPEFQPQKITTPADESSRPVADTVVLNVEPKINIGGIAYYIPPTMKVGVVYVVRLRISRFISKSLSDGLPDRAVVAPIRVGGSMSAELTDESPDTASFDIKRLNTAVQSVENDSSFTTWEWSLMPIRSGNQKLKLMVVIKTADLTKDIPVYEDSINVAASIPFTVKNWVKGNYRWLWTTTLMPFIVWWWKRRKKKKAGEAEDDAADTADKPETENAG